MGTQYATIRGFAAVATILTVRRAASSRDCLSDMCLRAKRDASPCLFHMAQFAFFLQGAGLFTLFGGVFMTADAARMKGSLSGW